MIENATKVDKLIFKRKGNINNHKKRKGTLVKKKK